MIVRSPNEQRHDLRIFDLAEGFDGLDQHLFIHGGRYQPFDRRQRERGWLIRERLGSFAAYGRIGRVGGQFGQRGNRLRGLHLADGLGSLGPYFRDRVGARHPQQYLD